MNEPIEEKKAKVKLIMVKTIKAKGEGALVEWMEKSILRRATVPLYAVQDSQVEDTVLVAGIPYGLPWEDVKLAQPKGADIANALRAAGIWTKQDLFDNPNKAIGILQAIYGVDLSALINFADTFRKEK